MELVSIIIPYYKKKEFISKTLNSIFKQTYTNYEILIIYDDKEKTDLLYLKKLTKHNSKIKIFVNNKNYGAGYSRNFGIKKSKGKFIAFIDSDDFWHKDKLYKQICFLKEKRINFCHTSYYIINDKLKITSLRKARNFFNINDLLGSCDIGLSSVMINKKLLLKNLFPKIKTKEDFVLWLKLLKKGHNLIAIDEPLTYWRRVKNSLSSNNVQKIKDGYIVYRKYMKMNILKSLYYLTLLGLNSLLK